jgi:hypothetical protein
MMLTNVKPNDMSLTYVNVGVIKQKLKWLKQVNEKTRNEAAAHSPEARGASEIQLFKTDTIGISLKMRRLEVTCCFVSQKGNPKKVIVSKYDRIEVLIKTYYGTYYILSTIQTFIYRGLRL